MSVAYVGWQLGIQVMANAECWRGSPKKFEDHRGQGAFVQCSRSSPATWHSSSGTQSPASWCSQGQARERLTARAEAGASWSLFIPAHMHGWGQCSRTRRGRMVATAWTSEPSTLCPWMPQTSSSSWRPRKWQRVRICFLSCPQHTGGKVAETQLTRQTCACDSMVLSMNMQQAHFSERSYRSKECLALSACYIWGEPIICKVHAFSLCSLI